MIHGVYANKPSFHSVEFTPGLNVIVAERTDISTQRDTRNGLGKSTLIEIIHFCLGSSAKRGKGLLIPDLAGWEFTLDITVAGNRVRATRAVDNPNRVIIDGPTSGWIEQPDDGLIGRVLHVNKWKKVLGWGLFGLQEHHEDHKHRPSYRSLISYFIRKGPDAYIDPFRYFRSQKEGHIQLHIAFLLGLNWEYAARWQELREQEQALKAMKQAIKTGAIEHFIGTIGELEAERVQLEDQLDKERQALETFRVHPQYEDLQARADQLTRELHELANRNITDRRKLSRYKEAIANETPPPDSQVERLYEEVGLVFPDTLKKTLAEAKEFHKQIIENRKAFLESEVNRLERQLADRDEHIRKLTEERAVVMEILKSHGALQELTILQERYLEMKERLERVRSQISEIKNITARKRDIKMAKVELMKAAEQDHEERREKWSTAVRLFNENSRALYETPGSLIIDISESGYKYDVEIQRSGSEGIAKMKIFCFDLMLSQLWSRNKDRIDFLIHDSIIFDGVDSRQRALALERAAEVSIGCNTQYICALNSDMVPYSDFKDDFKFDDHVRLTLTDKDPSGSLLGIRFQRPGR